MTPLYTLSIGVDFGVSTSGISYCIKGPDEPATAATSVTLRGGTGLEPSALGNTGRQDSWGSGIAAGEDKFTLFKLSLLHPDALRQGDQQHPERLATVRHAFAKLEAAGRGGVDVVSDYLRRLWAAAGNQIHAEMRVRELEPADIDIRFVFGIPAVWGEDAVSRMKEAINNSCLLQLPGRLPASLSFIAEPEAAAIAVLPQMARGGGLKNGQTVVICDCGGGTVDVISYEITSIDPLAVREFVCGEGQLLGDMFMRGALEALIKDSIPGYATNANLNQVALDREIEEAWQRVSRLLSSTMRAASWSHRLQLRSVDGSAEGSVVIRGRDIVRVLKTVTDDVLALTQRQVDGVKKKGRQADLVVVLGGFGMNRFLQSEFRCHFQTPVAFAGEDGQFAVKNGAAMAGMVGNFAALSATGAEHVGQPQIIDIPRPIHIQSRVARRSYGYQDPNGPMNQVVWFVSEGQHVPVDPLATFTLPSAAFTTSFQNQPCVIIYCTPLPMPPVSTVSGQEPVSQVCRIKCERPDVLGRLVQSVDVSMQLRGVGMQLCVSSPGNAQQVAFSVVY